MKNSTIDHMDKVMVADDLVHHPLLYYDSSYYLKVSIGTPRQEVFMLFDSAAKASWIGCSKQSFSNPNLGFFDPSLSFSYKNILCDSPLCTYQLNLEESCNLEDPIPCDFFQNYEIGPAPIGILSQDVFGVGMHGIQVPNISFGCVFEGYQNCDLPNGFNPGIIAMNQQSDFLTRITSQYNHSTMSYCLANQAYYVNTTSWISFGGQTSEHLNYTSSLGTILGEFVVNFKSIMVENVTLDFNSTSQGITLDTGSQGTYLREPLHSKFLDVFVAAMKTIANVYLDSEIWPGQTCYKFDNGLNVSNIQVPNITIHLDDNVHLHLGIENIFLETYLDDENNSILCLAFLKHIDLEDSLPQGTLPPILGSTTQQNFHVEIDMEHNKVGFTCTKCENF